MSTVKAATGGYAPSVLVQPVVKDKEQTKYERMWDIAGYREFAPGEQVAQIFLEKARIKPDDEIIDFGAGTGRGALMLAYFGRAKVTMLDFAENCLDDDVRNALYTQNGRLSFLKADLRKPSPITAKYGFCTDVMEHIEPEFVDQVMANVMKAAQHVFFQISLVPDEFGVVIGETLHLTVKPYQWWLNKFNELGAAVVWSQDGGSTAMFYVSAWNDAAELVKLGSVNVGNEEIINNVLHNIKRDIPQVKPYERQENTVMILAGGPSLNDFADEIVQKRLDGCILVTVNGTYNWALEHGLNPSAQIIVDAREHNKRFVEPAVPGCRYLLASQCHPSVIDAAPEGQVVMWHSAIDDGLAKELDAHYGKEGEAWYPCVGGSTVMLRAIPLLRMLGFYKFEVYGFDSCVFENGVHHAYKQGENTEDGNSDRWVKVVCGERIFACTPWQASQSQEFMDLIGLLGDEVELDVAGDGLISCIIKTAAESSTDEILTVVN